jgi:hypothetical protein
MRLSATLDPKQPGAATTVGFGFQIAAPAGRVPPALTQFDLLLPAGLGIAVSGLGMADCSVATLEALGVSGCPADSVMGHGSAATEILIGSRVIGERAQMTIVRAPTENGHLGLALYLSYANPFVGATVFRAQLLPAAPPFGERMRVSVPLIATLPGGPYVTLVRLQATLGPTGLIYSERIRGKLVYYRPRGILLPDRCPRRGFRFAAELAFLDGTSRSAHTDVACPLRRRSH